MLAESQPPHATLEFPNQSSVGDCSDWKRTLAFSFSHEPPAVRHLQKRV